MRSYIRVLTSPFQPFQPAIKKPHLDQILAVRPSFVWDLEPHEHIPWPCTWMLDHRNSCLAAAWRSHSCHHTWRTKITHERPTTRAELNAPCPYMYPLNIRERLSFFYTFYWGTYPSVYNPLCHFHPNSSSCFVSTKILPGGLGAHTQLLHTFDTITQHGTSITIHTAFHVPLIVVDEQTAWSEILETGLIFHILLVQGEMIGCCQGVCRTWENKFATDFMRCWWYFDGWNMFMLDVFCNHLYNTLTCSKIL